MSLVQALSLATALLVALLLLAGQFPARMIPPVCDITPMVSRMACLLYNSSPTSKDAPSSSPPT